MIDNDDEDKGIEFIDFRSDMTKGEVLKAVEKFYKSARREFKNSLKKHQGVDKLTEREECMIDDAISFAIPLLTTTNLLFELLPMIDPRDVIMKLHSPYMESMTGMIIESEADYAMACKSYNDN